MCIRDSFLTQKNNRQLFLTKSLISGAFGLALSAFFWLPSMVERSYTLVDTILLNELAKYAIHFVQPQQLWYSPWGFGGSVEGLGDGLSFQINKPYIGMVFLTTLLWLWFYRTQKSKHIEKNIRLISGYFLFMLIASVFLMLPYSKFIWDSISYLQYLQFPWRLMAFVGLFISFFSASFIYLLTKTIRQMCIRDRHIYTCLWPINFILSIYFIWGLERRKITYKTYGNYYRFSC